MSNSRSCYLIYISIVTFVILIAFEYVILPWHFNLPRDLALIGFTAEPNIVVDDTPINSIGFSGDVIDLENDPGKIRILTLGGSSMFNRRMAERLKKSLNSVSDRPVEILGAALRTHTSMSSLIKYSALSKYTFDYVIIYHSINDLFVNHVEPGYFKDDYSHMLPWYKRNILLDNSLIARIIYNNFIWGRGIFGGKKIWYIYPERNTENKMNFISEQLFKRNITMLVEEVRKNGGTPILMTFAWSIPDTYSLDNMINGTLAYNNPAKYDQQPVELWGSIEYVREGLQRHNRVIRQISRENNILLLDQENLIGKNLHWFGDICHLSEEGTDKFIDNIMFFFIENRLFDNN